MSKYSLTATKQDFQILYEKLENIEKTKGNKFDWKKIKRSTYDQLYSLVGILERRTC